MQGDPIGGLGRAELGSIGLEASAELVQLLLEGLGDEDFIETACPCRHRLDCRGSARCPLPRRAPIPRGIDPILPTKCLGEVASTRKADPLGHDLDREIGASQ